MAVRMHPVLAAARGGIVAAHALMCKHSEISKLVHVDAKGHKWFIVKSSKSELKTRPVIHSVNFMEPS